MLSPLKKLSLVAALSVPASLLGAQQTWAEETGGGPDYSFAYFLQPADDASYPEAPALVEVQVGVYTGLDDAGVDVVNLFLDGEMIDSQSCPQGCTFDPVEVAQGAHELRISDDSGNVDSRTVYVDEEVPSDPGETGGQEDSGSDKAGCQVTDQPVSPWTLLALPALLLIPGLRRARRG